MRTSQLNSHWAFACLMTVLLALPIFGLFGTSAIAEKTSRESSIAEKLEESWKTGLVEGALLFNTHLNNFDIKTEVSGGTATLKGRVNTDLERALAEQVALNVQGINEVENELTVDPDSMPEKHTQQSSEDTTGLSGTLSDNTITVRVKSQLLAIPEASGLAINVDTTDQIVTLTGEVESELEKELAYYIARNTGGVRQVVNEININP